MWPNRLRAGSRSTVSFTTAAAGPVSLVVVDVLGREVVRLVDAPMDAGTHTASLDAAALPAGAYVVRLDAGGVVASRVITLTR